MKKNCCIIIRSICFMLIFVGLLYYFSNVLTVRNVERYPVRNGFWQTFDAEEDNSIDALFDILFCEQSKAYYHNYRDSF